MSSGQSDRTRAEDVELGEILREVIDRRRAGDEPAVADYVARYPHLRERIEGHFRMVGLLEDLRAGGGSSTGDTLGEAISSLPQPIQRAIFLRHFERRSWRQIAQAVGEPEEKLRRGYARAVRELIARCAAEPRA